MNYAGFWRRFAAVVIDGIILWIPSLVLGVVVSGQGIALGGGIILGFLYRPFFDSSALKGTPGKALMNIEIRSEAGNTLTFKQAVIRFFSSYLSGLILCIGYLMQPFTAKRQALHDMIAETVVLKRETTEDINYFKVWKDQFKLVMDRL